MSVVRVYEMTCDECGDAASFDVASKAAARTEARNLGEYRAWAVGLKASVQRPSLYDVLVDLCPNCLAYRDLRLDRSDQ